MFKELFTEDKLDEGLRIVKHAEDKRQAITKDIHDKEISHAKAEMDPYQVGYIGDIKIMKSKHATEIRDQDKFSRSYNIDNETFLNIFRKLFLKPTFRPKTKTAVVYKNKKGKWDVLICELRGKILTIITVIKKGERIPFSAKPSKRDTQVNIIVEEKLNGIEIHKIEEWIIIQ